MRTLDPQGPFAALARESWYGPLPPACTVEWVSRFTTSEPNALRRLENEVRLEKRVLFPPLHVCWPDEGIDAMALAGIVHAGLQFAGGLNVANFHCKRSFAEMAMQPFVTRVGIRLTEASNRSKYPILPKDVTMAVAKAAQRAGDLDFLRMHALVAAAAQRHGAPEDLVELVRKMGPAENELAAHMERSGPVASAGDRAHDLFTASIRPESPAPGKPERRGEHDPSADTDLDGIEPDGPVDDMPLPLPSFATVEWLSGKMAMSGQVLSGLHAGRHAIRSGSGDDSAWPEERLSGNPLARQFLASLRRPLTLPSIAAALGTERSHSVFRPLYRACEAQARLVMKGLDRRVRDPSNMPDAVLFAAVWQANRTLARDFALLRGAETLDDVMLHVMRVAATCDPEREVVAYLLERKRMLFRVRATGRMRPDLAETVSFSAPATGEEDAEGLDNGQDATEAPADDLDAATERWHAALAHLSADAGDVHGTSPNPEAMATIREAMAAVEEAWAAYETIPKGVDATPLVERLSTVRDTIASLAADHFEEGDAPGDVPSPNRITEAAAVVVDGLATASEEHLGIADGARVVVLEVQAQMAATRKAAAITALSAKLNTAMDTLGAEFSAASESYAMAIRTLAEGAVTSTVARQAPGFALRTHAVDPEATTARTEAEAETPVAGSAMEPEATAGAVDASVRAVGDAALPVDGRPDPGIGVGDAGRDAPATGHGEFPGANARVALNANAEAASDVDVDVLESLATAEATDDAIPASSVARGGAHADDVERDEWDAGLRRLVRVGEYGLAHHLARAAEAARPGVRLMATPAAMRLAAVAGNLDHTTLQATPDKPAAWVYEHLSTREARGEEVGEDAAAMALAVWPAALELALFHRNSGAVEIIRRDQRVPPGLHGAATALADAVVRFANSNLTLTRTALESVDSEMDRDATLEDTRAEIIRRTEAFGRIQFPFQLGNKLRVALIASDGAVGRLRDGMAGDAAARLAGAEAYLDLTSSRGNVLDMLDRIKDDVDGRSKSGIDGTGRERMVSYLGDMNALAALYVETRREMEEARLRERPRIRETVSDIRRLLGDLVSQVEHLDASSEAGRVGPVVAKALRHLDGILSGLPGAPRPDQWLLALHGGLSLVPDLHFGRSWLPTPYEPSLVASILSSLSLPPLPAIGPTRDEAFAELVRDRVEGASHVGAKCLVDMAPSLGIDPGVVAGTAASVAQHLEAAREHLADDVRSTTRIVERVSRFGALDMADSEAADTLMDRVRRVAAAEVPALCPPDQRSEDPDGERIGDLRLAFSLLADVRAEAGALLEQPRDALLARIDGLAERMSEQDVASLRRLCGRDELHTAEEYVEAAERNGAFLAVSQRNARFEAFERTLDCLDGLGKELAATGRASVSRREELCGIPFQSLSQARSETASGLLAAWLETVRQLPACRDGGFDERLRDFLDGVGIGFASGPRVDEQLTRPNRRIYVADGTAAVPRDAESLLLPDFGSRVQGHRIAVCQTMPSDADLNDVCRAASTLCVILLVGEFVDARERAAFHLRNLKAERRILLVDTASMLFSLGEREQRGLTLLELGQPYSYVAPYKDWQKEAVPPEMFVGRERDMTRIVDPDGSCIVYGGRRMGKTAKLKHIKATRHNPVEGMLVGYLDAQELVEGPNLTARIWPAIARSLPTLFPRPDQADKAHVEAAVLKWLDGASNRRVLLLIDESDRLVVADAAQDYAVFLGLQSLMTATQRRFKFVLSGLSNVTRLVQAGNPPLRQVAADPCRVGAFVGSELRDAESLVLKPFAAMGMAFEDRGDVWSLLSHSNYYPVLVQTYSQKLLTRVMQHVKDTGRPMRRIPPHMVAAVLDDDNVRRDIKDIFSYTLQIDPRYHLIAYAVAHHALGAEADGRLDASMSVREVREAAMLWWPAGFREQQRTTLFEDILDEMEGLGIVKHDGHQRWSLRQSGILRLLGSRDEIETGLLSYAGREAPREYDPKSMRRELRVGTDAVSPLTLSQERDIVVGRSPVHVVLGHELGDVSNVPGVLRTAPDSIADEGTYPVEWMSDATPETFRERLRRARHRPGERPILIVPANVQWTPQWVADALRTRQVADGHLQVVLVGGPEQAALMADDAHLRTVPPKVRVTTLEPWSEAYIDHCAKRYGVNWSAVAETSRAMTGDWNQPLSRVFAGLGRLGLDNRSDRMLRLVRECAPAMARKRLGLDGRHGTALAIMATHYADAAFTAQDVEEMARMDERGEPLGAFEGAATIHYGLSMGLLVPVATQGDERKAAASLTPLALWALGAGRAEAAA